MTSVLFLVAGALMVLVCNWGSMEVSTTLRALYPMVNIVVLVLAIAALRKYDKTRYTPYILIVSLIVYDVATLFFYQIVWYTYVAQVVVVGAYFLYGRWKRRMV